MDYETRHALSNKVEKWEFHGLQQEVSSLKQKNSELQRIVDEQSGRIRNYYYAIDQLLTILEESQLFNADDQLCHLRQYL
jgi:hypothetical protein